MHRQYHLYYAREMHRCFTILLTLLNCNEQESHCDPLNYGHGIKWERECEGECH